MSSDRLLPPSVYSARRPTLRDLGRDRVADIILQGGQAQADAALRGGDAWANAIGNLTQTATGALTQYGQAKDEADVQKAVAASRTAKGPADIESVLASLPPELQTRARDGIQKIQLAGAQVQEHNLQIADLKGKLADAETKRKTVAADYGAGLGKQISQWLPSADGGLSAATFGFAHAKELGTEGLEQIQPVLEGLSNEWEAAQASGDPAAIAAAAKKNRQTIGPLAQRLAMGGSPEWQEKNRAKLVPVPEGGSLANDQTGEVVVKGAPKRETRSVDEQIAAATLAGDDATVQKLLASKRASAEAGRDPNVAAARADAARARDAARFDAQTNHSYEYNDKKLEARAKPLTDQAARYDRLVTTVNEKTAQADALVAPELLTVMAGGSGSGLRMTKAELEAVVGGRDKLAGIEVALKQWVPGQALKFSDEQRAEIQKLLATMGERIEAKANAIEDARGALIDAKDVTAHRRILADLDKKLGDVGKSKFSVTAPDGKTYEFPSQAQADVFKKRAGIR